MHWIMAHPVIFAVAAVVVFMLIAVASGEGRYGGPGTQD